MFILNQNVIIYKIFSYFWYLSKELQNKLQNFPPD